MLLQTPLCHNHFMKNLKVSFVALSILFTTGCTTELAQHMSDQKDVVLEYDYGQIGKFIGLDQVFKSNADKEREAEKNICFHKNSGERILTVEGVEDKVIYRDCVLSPIPTHKAQRMEGR